MAMCMHIYPSEGPEDWPQEDQEGQPKPDNLPKPDKLPCAAVMAT